MKGNSLHLLRDCFSIHLPLGDDTDCPKSRRKVLGLEFLSRSMERYSSEVLRWCHNFNLIILLHPNARRYAGVIGGLSTLISTLTRSFNTPFELQELERFMEVNRDTLSLGQRAFRQSVEKTKANISWRARNLAT